MSAWGHVENKFGRELDRVKQLIGAYNYSNDNRARETDELLRKHLIRSIHGLKESLKEIMEAAYREKDERSESVKIILDNLDVAIAEIESINFWLFPDSGEVLEKLVSADLGLLSKLENLKTFSSALSAAVATTKSEEITKNIGELSTALKEFRLLLIERSDAIKRR